MQTSISRILRTVTRHIVGLTLYDMMRSSPDFEDVKVALNDRTNWSIELVSIPFSSSFNISHLCTNRRTVSQLLHVGDRCPKLHVRRLTIPRSIHLSNGGYFFMLCTLSFLVMAENIHIHYGRLSPAELKVYILCDMVIPSLT